jgi:hypothetical protein
MNTFHREACEILRPEAERREDGQPPEDIRLTSRLFDTLPSVGQLFNNVSTEPRRAA